MFGVEILEVAIGMSLTYLLLSTIVTGGIELVKRFTNMKPKTQLTALRLLLEEELDDKDSFVARLKNSTITKVDQKLGKWARVDDAKLFAKALLEGATQENFDKWKARVKKDINKIPDEGTRVKLLDFLENIEKSAEGKIMATHERVEQWTKAIEAWYTTAMSKAADWFKRQARWLSLAFAIIITVAFNADSIRIATILWNDTEVREATVAAATTYSKKLIKESDPNGSSSPDDEAKLFMEELDRLETNIRTAKDLPIGWGSEIRPGDKNFPGSPGIWWLFKILGLLFTSLAVSMGSGAWYRILKDLLKLRGDTSGANTEEPPATRVELTVAGAKPLPAETKNPEKSPEKPSGES